MYTILLALFVVAWTAVPALGATSRAITLYPDGASVQEQGIATKNGEYFEYVLPNDLQADTLRVALEGARVAEVTIVPAIRPESTDIAALRQRCKNAERAVVDTESRLAALHSRVALWQTPPVKGDSADTLRAVEQAMAERVPQLRAEAATLAEELQQRKETASQLQAELQRRTGNNATGQAPVAGSAPGTPDDTAASAQGLPVKLVRILAVSLDSSKPLPTETPATLSYLMDNCGWQLLTVLDALPAQGTVQVRREATVSQNTGQDWDKVTLTLSTARPTASAIPDAPRPWRILPNTNEARPSMARTAQPMAMKQDMDSVAFAAPAPPVRTENATADTWALGVRTVLSGDPLRITLDAQDWKADFVRLLRPSVRKAAWLVAEVTAPTPQQFASEPASVYVDHQFIGRMPLTFMGTTGNIAFGDDPAVTVLMEQHANRSGEAGLISKSQTRIWDWTIKTRNAHTFPVAVRVEEPAPQSGDERIKLTVKSTPQPVAKDHTLSWTFELKPDAENAIRHTVQFQAPEDMRINPGR